MLLSKQLMKSQSFGKNKCTFEVFIDLFGSFYWYRLNKVSSLDIKYGETHIKQYHTVKYLGCLLDETLFGESMALKVTN